jgi:hypothetical protein
MLAFIGWYVIMTEMTLAMWGVGHADQKTDS